MSILDSFLNRAALSGIGLALAMGPLGCFVIWRRMAFFGDATAHAAILGVGLAILLSVPLTLGALFVALGMALTVTWLSRRGMASDTALGALSHSALALGLLLTSALPGPRLDLINILAGDILSVTRSDVAFVWAGAVAILGWIAWRWQPMLVATLNRDLARASGVDPDREELGFTLALAIVVALSIKLIGVLLIAALLLLPAAAARPLSGTPEAMAVTAAGLGICAMLGGLWLSVTYDLQTGPAIVSAAAAIFAITTVFGRRVSR